MFHPRSRRSWLLAIAIVTVGCVQRTDNEVVVYCALDQEFAAPIISGFVRKNEGKLVPKTRFDVESTKTVGLVNRILSEQDRPACDVFWNNEILHTVRLQKLGLLEKRNWPVPDDWPAGMKATDGSWCGFAARGRVLLINRQRLPNREQWPKSVSELADPKWKDQCAVGRPLFGTTATHFVLLHQVLGPEVARTFYKAVKENAVVMSGNKQVAQAVASGKVAWGLTDTDDAVIEKDDRMPVDVVWPDQGAGEPGTLRIPNTVGVLAAAPHAQAAAALADYLVDIKTEERLAMGDSAQLPLHRDAKVQSRMAPATPVRWMEADFEAAVVAWEELSKYLLELYP